MAYKYACFKSIYMVRYNRKPCHDTIYIRNNLSEKTNGLDFKKKKDRQNTNMIDSNQRQQWNDGLLSKIHFSNTNVKYFVYSQ